MVLPVIAEAQSEDGQRSGYDIGPLSFTGSVGFMSEAYAVSGIDSRKPPGTGRIFANASASAYGVRYGIDMDLSTEGSEFRQSLSRLGIDASYKWVTVAAGDVRPRFSRFSLSGINVRGGLIELTPGDYLFSATVGRTNRAVKPEQDRQFIRPAYEQWLYAGRVGYGDTGDNYIQLAGMVARDNENSLASSFDRPVRENANVSALIGFKLFDSKISFEGTGTISAFNEDTRLTGGNASGVWDPFIASGAGLRTDYAGEFQLSFTEESYGINTTYERVQPGFRSLGLSQIRNDQERISIKPQFEFLDRKVRVSLDYNHSRNNLLNTLASETKRNQYGIQSRIRLIPSMVISTSYRLLANRTDPTREGIENRSRQHAHNIMLGPSVNWTDNEVSHSASLTGNLQLFNMDRITAGQEIERTFTNISSTASYSLTFPSGLSLSPTFSLLSNDSESSKTNIYSTNMSGSYSFFDSKMTLGTNAGFSRSVNKIESGEQITENKSSQITLNVNASYRLPFGDTLRLNIRSLSNSGANRNFQEFQATLQLTHQF